MSQLLNKSNIVSFVNDIDNVLTDCDGVLWCQEIAIPRSNDALNKLRSLGKKIFYVTNNSTKSRDALVSKCEKHGFLASKDECISTSYITAQYLKQLNFQKKVYLIGSTGISSELDLVGIKHIGLGPDEPPEDIMSLTETTILDPEVGAVIVGFDGYFNIPKMMKAVSYLNDPECLFIATNTDERFPVGGGSVFVFPGTGACVKAVETAAGKEAIVMGKPNPRMFEVLGNKYNLDPKRTLMIGDKCNTDILLGKNCGLHTLFVETGINSLKEIEAWSKDSDPELRRLVPEYHIPSLGHLAELLDEF